MLQYFRVNVVGLVAGIVIGGVTLTSAGAAAAEDPPPYEGHIQCETEGDRSTCQIDLWLTRGYRAFSQCQVCHGLTGDGSTIGPSLIRKLREIGLDRFMEVVVNGYEGQIGVMPGWGTNPNVMNYIDQLYAYLLARADGVLPPGKLKRYDRLTLPPWPDGRPRFPGAARSLAFALVIAGACALPIAAGGAERTAFKVCADANYLPWSNDRQEGFENHIASLLAEQLGLPVEYTWFPQRMGFIRNTLRARGDDGVYRCDVVMGLPDGFELAITTDPYYRSTYALVFVEGRGLDSVWSASDLQKLDASQRNSLRFGLAERNPGTLWLAEHGMLSRLTKAYASQHGDPNVRPGQLEQEDLLAGNIDLTFMVGPHRRTLSSKQPRRTDPGHSRGITSGPADALRHFDRGTASANRTGRRSFRRCWTPMPTPSRPSCGNTQSP